MTSEEYDNLVKQEGTVLVDFYSDGCGPCRMLSPILEELNNVKVIKVNAGIETALAVAHGIKGVPTLKFYKDGQLKETMVGLQSKELLQGKINLINESS